MFKRYFNYGNFERFLSALDAVILPYGSDLLS